MILTDLFENTVDPVEENLRKWFKEKWVRFGPDGKIRGSCARGSESEGKPKCLPQSKAHALGKKGRASAAAKKRREDPDPERRGAAKNVATKVKEQYTDDDDWYDDEDSRLRDGDYVRDSQDGEYGEVFRMSGDPSERRVRILDRDGKGWYISPERLVAVDRDDPAIQRYFGKRRQRDMDEGKGQTALEKFRRAAAERERKHDEIEAKRQAAARQGREDMKGAIDRLEKHVNRDQVDEKQDACYQKVKSRYKVWPSAYASGALVQCRKKGAANWGNKKK